MSSDARADPPRWLDLADVGDGAPPRVVVDDYVPLSIETGHVAAQAVRTLSIRRPDGLGVFDVRQDASTGQLVSATLASFLAPVSGAGLEVGAARSLGLGLPVFVAGGRDGADVDASCAAIERVERPLEAFRREARFELAWSRRAIDGRLGEPGDSAVFLFAGTEWVGLVIDTLDESALARLDRALC